MLIVLYCIVHAYRNWSMSTYHSFWLRIEVDCYNEANVTWYGLGSMTQDTRRISRDSN